MLRPASCPLTSRSAGGLVFKFLSLHRNVLQGPSHLPASGLLETLEHKGFTVDGSHSKLPAQNKHSILVIGTPGSEIKVRAEGKYGTPPLKSNVCEG